MNIREHNRFAWNKQVEAGNVWTVPATPESIAAARAGNWEIVLTPRKPVPIDWLPVLASLHVLCLASGGGQQGPILAAAGAIVTVLDNSPRQLEQDRLVAERENLTLTTLEGDMANLEMLSDQSFDAIVHPVSNVFVPEVQPVWKEAFRVLRKGGVLLAGFNNPVVYIFDNQLEEQTGKLEVKYTLPYSDIETLTEEEKQRYQRDGIPFEFSHTLEEQIGGQIGAGFVIAGFYEDWDRPGDGILQNYTPTYIATRALKL